jgi:hypothetical protein
MEHEEKIASLLGDEKYMLLSEYEQTLPQRNKIKQFRQELEFSGVPMTPDQEMALLPILERFSAGNLQARMQNDMIASFPSNTPRIIEGELDILQDVLSEKQISILRDLQSRKESWRSLNYSWNGIGKRVREAR